MNGPNIDLEMKTYHQPQKNRWPSPLNSMTLSLEKTAAITFPRGRGQRDSEMASAGEDKKALVLMVADSLRQILFDVSSM